MPIMSRALARITLSAIFAFSANNLNFFINICNKSPRIEPVAICSKVFNFCRNRILHKVGNNIATHVTLKYFQSHKSDEPAKRKIASYTRNAFI